MHFSIKLFTHKQNLVRYYRLIKQEIKKKSLVIKITLNKLDIEPVGISKEIKKIFRGVM